MKKTKIMRVLLYLGIILLAPACFASLVKTKITPPMANSGQHVELLCEFPPDTEWDNLHWIHTGTRIYTHRRENPGDTGPKAGYEEKIQDAHLQTGLHKLKIRVNHCDTGIYNCLLLGRDVSITSDPQKLDIKEEIILEVLHDGDRVPCDSSCSLITHPPQWVQLVVTVTGVVLEPILAIKTGTKILSDANNTDSTYNAENCLYTTSTDLYLFLDEGEDRDIICDVSWGKKFQSWILFLKSAENISEYLPGSKTTFVILLIVCLILIILVIGVLALIIPKLSRFLKKNKNTNKATDEPEDNPMLPTEEKPACQGTICNDVETENNDTRSESQSSTDTDSLQNNTMSPQKEIEDSGRPSVREYAETYSKTNSFPRKSNLTRKSDGHRPLCKSASAPNTQDNSSSL